jgi:phosphinothricin acetyltransferase
MIREAISADISNDTCIYDVEPRALEVQMQWFEQQTSLKNPVLVALENNQVIGFASYAQYRPKVGYKHSMEHSVYLHPEYANKGWGKQLMQALINQAKAQQVHVLIGGIDAQNESSILFHQKLGFEQVGRMNEVGHKFGRWLDLVWMQKIL